jgi:hypothetical protein
VLQLVETNERDARGHSCETFLYERRIHEHAIVAHDVGETPVIGIELRSFQFEMDPPV